MSDSTPKKDTASAEDPQSDLLLDHNYDGIQEYDNPMPQWWVLLFWGTFLFAVGYFFHYQLSPNGKGAYDDYEAEMARAAEEAEKRALAEQVTEESLRGVMEQEPMVLAGQAVFQQRCVTCHLDKGQGKIGPNLTDETWLHGCDLMDIYNVVNNGVIEKGMQAWGKTLKPIELRQVVAYVGSIRGTNVAGKAPQGERCVPNKGAGEATPEQKPKGTQPDGADAGADIDAADEEAADQDKADANSEPVDDQAENVEDQGDDGEGAAAPNREDVPSKPASPTGETNKEEEGESE